MKMAELMQQCHCIDMPDGSCAVFLVTEGFRSRDEARAFMKILKESSMMDDYGKVAGASVVVTSDLKDE